MKAIRVVRKCSEEVACKILEMVAEDIVDGCTELLGLYVAQECVNAADKKEVTQYIESAASKAFGMGDTNNVLREARQRVVKKARFAPAIGRKRKVV